MMLDGRVHDAEHVTGLDPVEKCGGRADAHTNERQPMDLGEHQVRGDEPDPTFHRLAQQALAQEPDNPRGLWAAGRAYLAKGMVTEAIAAHERLSAVAPPWRWVVGTTYALVGRAADASLVAAEIEHQPRSAWNAMGLAYIYTALGDRDAAFRWLAHERSHAWVPWVRVDPYFTSLHSDPRFAELLRRFNLPPLP